MGANFLVGLGPYSLDQSCPAAYPRHAVAAARGPAAGMGLVGGFFTFPFNRMLGGWLFG